MKIKQLGEVCWKFYYDGRPKATAQTLSEVDIMQMCFLSFGEIIRQRYYDSKKNDENGMPDYSFVSPLLDLKKFTLSDVSRNGMRRAEMLKYDLFRLPHNAHITNVYPVGSDCEGKLISNITQVSPGEENFYLSPEFSEFKFFVVKGRGLNFYNIPSCVKEVEVEATYSTEDVDVTLDIAYEVALAVLGVSGKVNSVPVKILDNSYSPQPREIKHRLQEAELNT